MNHQSCFITRVFHISNQLIDPHLCMPKTLLQKWQTICSSDSFFDHIKRLQPIYTWIHLDYKDDPIQHNMILKCLFENASLLQEMRYCCPPLWLLSIEDQKFHAARQLEATQLVSFLERVQWISQQQHLFNENISCLVLYTMDQPCKNEAQLQNMVQRDLTYASSSVTFRFWVKVFFDASRNHWQALLIDFHQHEINMYDSLGCQWEKSIMYYYVKQLEKRNIFTYQHHDKKWKLIASPQHHFHHQKGSIMCGMYVLYFIIQRIFHHISMNDFIETIISDDEMMSLQPIYFYIPGLSELPYANDNDNDNDNQNQNETKTWIWIARKLAILDFFILIRQIQWPNHINTMKEIQCHMARLYDEVALHLPWNHILTTIQSLETRIKSYLPTLISWDVIFEQMMNDISSITNDMKERDKMEKQIWTKVTSASPLFSNQMNHWWKTEYQSYFPTVQLHRINDSEESYFVHCHILKRLYFFGLQHRMMTPTLISGFQQASSLFKSVNWPVFYRYNISFPELEKYQYHFFQIQELWAQSQFQSQTIPTPQQQQKQKPQELNALKNMILRWHQYHQVPNIQWNVMPCSSFPYIIQLWNKMTSDLKNIKGLQKRNVSKNTNTDESHFHSIFYHWILDSETQHWELQRWFIWMDQSDEWIYNELQSLYLIFFLWMILHFISESKQLLSQLSKNTIHSYHYIRVLLLKLPISNFIRACKLYHHLMRDFE